MTKINLKYNRKITNIDGISAVNAICLSTLKKEICYYVTTEVPVYNAIMCYPARVTGQ